MLQPGDALKAVGKGRSIMGILPLFPIFQASFSFVVWCPVFQVEGKSHCFFCSEFGGKSRKAGEEDYWTKVGRRGWDPEHKWSM